MININVYKNGWEICGHAEVKICHQVSLWHWIASEMMFGLDKDTKEYTSVRDNKQNPNEGYSYCIFKNHINNIDWILEDFVISAEKWGKDSWGNQVKFNKLNAELNK